MQRVSEDKKRRKSFVVICEVSRQSLKPVLITVCGAGGPDSFYICVCVEREKERDNRDVYAYMHYKELWAYISGILLNSFVIDN